MIQIVTDSCADLSESLINKYKIKIVPLEVFCNNQSFQDGTLTLQELFASVDQTGVLPKTSAPSIADFMETFSLTDQSIYIGISTELSATQSNSQLAAQQLPSKEIYTIDSRNLSTGIGLLVLKAAELRDAGWQPADIAEEIRQTTARVRTSFVIDTMDYLYKGGRCTPLQAVFGSMLKIRPVIEVRPDGTLGVKDKIRGRRQKALNAMIDDFKSQLNNLDPHRVFVTHTGCDADAAYLVEELRKLAPIEDICVTYAGATVASHCGPNTIGILFIVKE